MAEISLASPMVPTKLALMGGIEAHHEFLEQASFTGGLELHPMRGSRLTHELARAATNGTVDASEILRSGHQSYLSTAEGMMSHDTLSEWLMHAKAIAVFHTAKRSLDKISHYLQAASSNDIPVVTYPEIGHNPQEHGITVPIFQPNVRVSKKWNVATTDQLLARAKSEGMAGIAWDGYHYLRAHKDGTRMEDWREALPRYLGNVAVPMVEVHVSVGRTDRHEDPVLMAATSDEMDIFMNRPREIGTTVTGQMLRIIHDATNGNMRYVFESVPPKDVPRDVGLKTLANNLSTFLDSGS